MAYAISRAPAGTPMAIAQRQDATMMVLRRWLGTWIDFALFAGAFFGPPMVLGDEVLRVWWMVCLAAIVIYYPLTEGLWGRTLGKLLTGMVVVNRRGEKPGIGRAALRTLLRLVEVNPFLVGGLPAGIIVLMTQNHQRLGDMAADTYVIPSSELWRLSAPTASVFD